MPQSGPADGGAASQAGGTLPPPTDPYPPRDEASADGQAPVVKFDGNGAACPWGESGTEAKHHERAEAARGPSGDAGYRSADLPEWLLEGADWAAAAFGLDGHAALMIALAAVGAAAGPARRLRVPGDGRVIRPALDLLLVGGGGSDPHGACRALLGPVSAEIASVAGLYDRLSPRQVRLMRATALHQSTLLGMAYDEVRGRADAMRAERAAGKMPSVMRSPVGWEDVNLEREEDAALGRLREARAKLPPFELALRPVVRTSGLSGRLVADWAGRTFDGHVADLLPDGAAILRFLSGPPRELREVLGFLDRIGSGDAAVCQGAGLVRDAGCCLLWCCGADELGRVLGRVRAADGSLARRLLAVPARGTPPGTAAPPGPPPHAWSKNIAKFFFAARLEGERPEVDLSPEAAGLRSAQGRELAGEADGGRRADLVARIALGLHISAHEKPVPIGGDTFALATGIAREAWARHGAATASPGSGGGEGDVAVPSADIVKLVDKLRDRGPCSQRDLFRRYHRQGAARILPVLGAAIEMGLVVKDDRLLRVAGPGDRQRVSASAGAK